MTIDRETGTGDIIRCPRGHRHRHGATPTSAMTHLALQEAFDGKVVAWMEKVTDEEYLAGPNAGRAGNQRQETRI